MNFNWVLSSFEPYIRGVRNLIDFSLTSQHRPFLLFVSSVSAVGNWKGRSSVPEEPIYDLTMASKMGYGQSKLISECLLDQASRISGARSACCRVGIVAGPVEKRMGVWNRHEYIPSVGCTASLYLSSWESETVQLACAHYHLLRSSSPRPHSTPSHPLSPPVTASTGSPSTNSP